MTRSYFVTCSLLRIWNIKLRIPEVLRLLCVETDPAIWLISDPDPAIWLSAESDPDTGIAITLEVKILRFFFPFFQITIFFILLPIYSQFYVLKRRYLLT